MDAADLGSLEAWIASSAEQLGGIDIYVHNTSGKPQKVLDDWSKNFEIDLKALVGGVAAAQEALGDGGGALVSIGTTAAAEHFASGSGSYSAFKAAGYYFGIWEYKLITCLALAAAIIVIPPLIRKLRRA